MSEHPSDDFLGTLHRYTDRGWSLIPVPLRSKRPVLPNWQHSRIAKEDLRTTFPSMCNVGVLLGEPSGMLVDVDIDCAEAMLMAPILLPSTPARFGHGTRAESHWLYQVSSAIETSRYKDPASPSGDHGSSLIELRSTGCQTVVPPSLHPSGEAVNWASDGQPAMVDRQELLAIVRKVAAASILVRHWPGEGGRHDAAMALAGGLLRGGWSRQSTGQFIGLVARTAGDRELEDRVRAVTSSADNLAAGRQVTGWPSLTELVDARVIAKVIEWLDIPGGAGKAGEAQDAFDSYESNASISRDSLAAERRARLIAVPAFPLEAFPPQIQRFLQDGASTVGCPVDLIAVPFLGYVAAANGRQRRLALKRNWIRKATTWVAVVASSGDGKSPADAYARAALDVLQDEADERYQEQLADYKRELGSWKAKDPATRGDEPSPPRYEHWYTTDPTVESLAPMLAANSGVAAAFDELVAWARGCNSYKKGGNDRQKYLELWNGRPLKIDRKTQGVIFVRDPVCCLVGGIQPERLPEMASDGSIHDGLVPRFLWTYPDVQPSLWEWDTPDMEHLDPIVDRFRRLRSGPPQVLSIHPEAAERWETWYNANRQGRDQLPPLAREMASKMPSHLASLWLTLHCLWDPDGEESRVRLAQLDGAIALVEYFRAHARRVAVHFGTQTPGTSLGLVSRVATILHDAGDWTRRTDLSHALHRNVKAADLDAALASLVAEGQIESMQEGEGVRATTMWRWTAQDSLDHNVADQHDLDSYEGTNQIFQGSIGSFDSYESKMTHVSIQRSPAESTCCVCGVPLAEGRRLLCETCSEEMTEHNDTIFGESPEDAA